MQARDKHSSLLRQSVTDAIFFINLTLTLFVGDRSFFSASDLNQHQQIYLFERRRDIQHNDTQHNDTGPIGRLSIAVSNYIMLGVEVFFVMLSVVILNVVMLNVVAPFEQLAQHCPIDKTKGQCYKQFTAVIYGCRKWIRACILEKLI